MKFGHVQNGRNVQICNELVDQLCNRQGEFELGHDPDPSTTLFVTFPSEVHGLILHNRHLRGNDIVVVCLLVRNHKGIMEDYSFAKFHVREVSNWLQNKSNHKPFVNAIPKCDHFQSMSQHITPHHCSTSTPEYYTL